MNLRIEVWSYGVESTWAWRAQGEDDDGWYPAAWSPAVDRGRRDVVVPAAEIVVGDGGCYRSQNG